MWWMAVSCVMMPMTIMSSAPIIAMIVRWIFSETITAYIATKMIPAIVSCSIKTSLNLTACQTVSCTFLSAFPRQAGEAEERRTADRKIDGVLG